MRFRRNYLICTTPRSGSSLLCSLLGSTAVAGMQRRDRVGHEYLLELVGRPDQRRGSGMVDADGLRRFIADAFDRSRTPNGVGGFKVMWEQVRRLALLLGRTASPRSFGFHDFATLLPGTTQFVWLRRRERLRQAVSLVKAVQSQCWNSAEQARFAGTYAFDYVALERTVRMLGSHEAMWREFFERNAIEPLEVAYEDVVDDRRAQVQRIADFVGVAGAQATDIGEVHYLQQSELVNEVWVRRLERIRGRGRGARRLHTVLGLPRWIRLRALSRYRAARRVRRLPSGERI